MDMRDEFFERVNSFTVFYEKSIMHFHRRQEMEGLSQLEFKIINEIDCHGTVKVSELAEYLGLSMPNISRYIKRVQSLGLIVKEQDTEDRRVFYVKLSGKGRSVMDSSMARTREKADPLLKMLSESEMKELIAAMDLIESSFDRIMLRDSNRI